jgi:hypothetical protein
MTRSYSDGDTFTSWGVVRGDSFYTFGDGDEGREIAERAAEEIVADPDAGYCGSLLSYWSDADLEAE